MGGIPMSSLDKGGIFQRAPRQLRDCVPEGMYSLGLHFESALLRHRSIPAAKAQININDFGKGIKHVHIIRGEQCAEKEDVCRC